MTNPDLPRLKQRVEKSLLDAVALALDTSIGLEGQEEWRIFAADMAVISLALKEMGE